MAGFMSVSIRQIDHDLRARSNHGALRPGHCVAALVSVLIVVTLWGMAQAEGLVPAGSREALWSSHVLLGLTLALGYTPYFLEGHEPRKMHELMAKTLDTVIGEIQRIRPRRAVAASTDARAGR